ncbi:MULTISPECIES: Crp/Fnr family transcriptional regulator [unclassified Tenacibaculum]|uniref:Crp/Fnr family transcriptional regulator n=1 Tax=Tenacibaculum TaxID=104267 RepID=UPI001F2447C2|nr:MULTISPECIES: Crp/Fnr family transcriptional regulator [unclassified Tenacibaculum]MCF2875208.1 Crp/Fnr family transcriptional regulator [Tenacibaculum sp. Cn5-1]MCF2935284.1 Crp/Fnr family transcriptional regulator [Tenacibaculum sp. Cn5-34]MCG7511274.1 Crp/Fnr family transcriptional regulator [Tenacibaculum sp. Cn5-46]
MHPLRQHIEEIISLSDDEFDFVLSHFEHTKKRKNQYILQEGEIANKEYWVLKGCLKSCFFDDNGKEHILQFGMENWWITDYESFVKQSPTKLSIDCIEDSELLYITYENREKLTQSMHKMERFWAKKSKYGRIALQNRILSLLKNSTKERYELLLKQYPKLFQRVPKKLIAAYLGVSRETLSRLKS